MEFIMHFRNLRPNEDLKDYIQKKVSLATMKFNRVAPIATELDLTKRRHQYTIRCRIDAQTPVVAATNGDVFACVDLISEKIASILRREKSKRVKKQKTLKRAPIEAHESPERDLYVSAYSTHPDDIYSVLGWSYNQKH